MSARPCQARAGRGSAHGRAWVRVRANCRAVQGSWCAHAAVDHRELVENRGVELATFPLHSTNVSPLLTKLRFMCV